MRIKPKNPKLLHIRRIALGVLGLAVVLGVLLYTRNSGETEVEGDTEDTAVELTDGTLSEGELSWEYPEGWVDYSDLPDRDTLGDEDMPGLSNWRYLLVNGLSQENYLKESYYPDMEYIESGYSFQKRAADDLRAFIAAARAEGYSVSISRTWMSYADQRTRFNGLASTLYDQGGMTLAEAETEITAEGYFPGADEHQTGLAVNFVDYDGDAKFSTPVLQWMTEHCAEYGFILRFPEGREEYTGHKAEPGHYRYVGQVAAEYIMRKGITLEEFLNAYDEDAEVDLKEVWKW